MGKGIDPFESSAHNQSQEQKPRDSATLQTALLGTCFQCHSARGVFSVLSYTGFVGPSHSDRPATLAPVEIAREARSTIYWKQRQYNWGLLHGLWLQNE
jgi:hypothetical protein